MTNTAIAQEADTAEIRLGDAEGDGVEDGAKEKIQNPWIGVAAGPVENALRAHLDIPGNSGLTVVDVVPNSPAENAGLQKFDILIRADKNPLATPSDLADIVGDWDGTTDGVKLEWIRKGKELSEIITPAERPAGLGNAGGLGAGAQPLFGGGPGFQNLQKQLQQQLGGQGLQGPNGMRFRILGPGMQSASSSVKHVNKNGLDIKITRNNDDPAKIEVSDGDNSWKLDEESVDELPEEIAKQVRPLLKNGGGDQFRMELGGRIQPPNLQAIPNLPGMEMPGFKEMQKEMERIGIPRMEERFEDMERQMERMLEQIERLQVPQAVPAPAEDQIDPNKDA